MPPNQKPTSHLGWVPDTASNNIAPPPASVRATGFQAGQPLVAQYLNQAFHTLDQWVQYLDESSNGLMLASSLNHSMRLLGGGTFAFDATTRVLSWSQAIVFAVPSSKDSDNVAPAGSVMLPAGNVAFVQVNLPFSTTGDVTSGSTDVINLGFEDGIAQGMAVTGNGIAAGTTVTSVSEGSCVLSQAVTATAAQTTLTFVSSGALHVQVSASASLVPGPTTVILARALDTVCSVGIGSTEMWLRDQERRSLVGAGYVITASAPAGEALAAFRPVYMSPGAADGRTQGSYYLTDASAANGARRSQCIGFTHTASAAGATARVVQSGTLTGFSGLQAGTPYYLDPTAIGGISMSAPANAGQYVTPVGVAISTTALLVQIGAPRVVVIPGSVSSVEMGTLWQTQTNGTVQLGGILRRLLYNDNTGANGVTSRQFIAPFAGSVLQMSGMAFSSVAGYAQFSVRVNQLFGPSSNVNLSAGTMAYPSFDITEGQQTFGKGDQVSLYVTFFKADGTALINANVQAYGDVSFKYRT